MAFTIDHEGIMRDEQGNPVPPGAAPAAPAAPVAPQVAGTPARGGGQYTPEERAYLFQKMPQITAGEEELARLNAMSQELRGTAEPVRGKMDWASQGARALGGVGSGLADKQAKEQRSTMSAQMKDLGMNWPGLRKNLTDEDYGLTGPGWN